mmetsp:Transcript_7802/g.12393  ORF Transcript_7802/g.12393 Transcript_7802/m.12393 type:complete len:414 (-) Transcript_7802:101-1342(-)
MKRQHTTPLSRRMATTSGPPSSHLTTFVPLLLLLFIVTVPRMASAWSVDWINLGSKIGGISPPRSGHVAFELDGKVFVFGGYAEESPEKRYPINDLWVYDPKKEGEPASWTEVNTPSSPQQRLAAAAVTCKLDDKTTAGLVVGGWDSQEAGTGGVILQDLQAYMQHNTEWKELSFDLEEPTSRLCAVTLGDGPSSKVLVHNHRCTDHVIVLDLIASKMIRQPTLGTAPSARGLHTCAQLPNSSKIVLFGGAAQSGDMSNELFILDSHTWTWESVEVEGDPDASLSKPSPRASPCLVALDEQTCVVFGGASRTNEGGLHGCSDTWLLELVPASEGGKTKAKWKLVYPDGAEESPPGRNAATLTPLSKPAVLQNGGDKTEQYFLLSGGWYPFRTTYADNYLLKVSKTDDLVAKDS